MEAASNSSGTGGAPYNFEMHDTVRASCSSLLPPPSSSARAGPSPLLARRIHGRGGAQRRSAALSGCAACVQAQAQFWKQRCAKETRVCVGNRDSLYPHLRADKRAVKQQRVEQLEARIAEEKQGRLALQGELQAIKTMLAERGLVE
jgi:hypothetical protein